MTLVDVPIGRNYILTDLVEDKLVCIRHQKQDRKYFTGELVCLPVLHHTFIPFGSFSSYSHLKIELCLIQRKGAGLVLGSLLVTTWSQGYNTFSMKF